MKSRYFFRSSHLEKLEERRLFSADFLGTLRNDHPLDARGYYSAQIGEMVFAAVQWEAMGTELVVSDGNSPFRLLKDIHAGSHSSEPFQFIQVGETLFFLATDELGRNLYRSDGTEAGTSRLTSFTSRNETPNDEDQISDLAGVSSRGVVYYVTRGDSKQVWFQSSELGAAPVQLSGRDDSSEDLKKYSYHIAGEWILFADDSIYVWQPPRAWISDGTDAGTHSVAGLPDVTGWGENVLRLEDTLAAPDGALLSLEFQTESKLFFVSTEGVATELMTISQTQFEPITFDGDALLGFHLRPLTSKRFLARISGIGIPNTEEQTEYLFPANSGNTFNLTLLPSGLTFARSNGFTVDPDGLELRQMDAFMLDRRVEDAPPIENSLKDRQRPLVNLADTVVYVTHPVNGIRKLISFNVVSKQLVEVETLKETDHLVFMEQVGDQIVFLIERFTGESYSPEMTSMVGSVRADGERGALNFVRPGLLSRRGIDGLQVRGDHLYATLQSASGSELVRIDVQSGELHTTWTSPPSTQNVSHGATSNAIVPIDESRFLVSFHDLESTVNGRRAFAISDGSVEGTIHFALHQEAENIHQQLFLGLDGAVFFPVSRVSNSSESHGVAVLPSGGGPQEMYTIEVNGPVLSLQSINGRLHAVIGDDFFRLNTDLTEFELVVADTVDRTIEPLNSEEVGLGVDPFATRVLVVDESQPLLFAADEKLGRSGSLDLSGVNGFPPGGISALGLTVSRNALFLNPHRHLLVERPTEATVVPFFSFYSFNYPYKDSAVRITSGWIAETRFNGIRETWYWSDDQPAPSLLSRDGALLPLSSPLASFGNVPDSIRVNDQHVMLFSPNLSLHPVLEPTATDGYTLLRASEVLAHLGYQIDDLSSYVVLGELDGEVLFSASGIESGISYFAWDGTLDGMRRLPEFEELAEYGIRQASRIVQLTDQWIVQHGSTDLRRVPRSIVSTTVTGEQIEIEVLNQQIRISSESSASELIEVSSGSLQTIDVSPQSKSIKLSLADVANLTVHGIRLKVADGTVVQLRGLTSANKIEYEFGNNGIIITLDGKPIEIRGQSLTFDDTIISENRTVVLTQNVDDVYLTGHDDRVHVSVNGQRRVHLQFPAQGDTLTILTGSGADQVSIAPSLQSTQQIRVIDQLGVSSADSISYPNSARLSGVETRSGRLIGTFQSGKQSIETDLSQSLMHNPIFAGDVSSDGSVTALDALIVINFLNRNDQNARDAALLRLFPDVNHDNTISAADALAIINHLNNPDERLPLQFDGVVLDSPNTSPPTFAILLAQVPVPSSLGLRAALEILRRGPANIFEQALQGIESVEVIGSVYTLKLKPPTDESLAIDDRTYFVDISDGRIATTLSV